MRQAHVQVRLDSSCLSNHMAWSPVVLNHHIKIILYFTSVIILPYNILHHGITSLIKQIVLTVLRQFCLNFSLLQIFYSISFGIYCMSKGMTKSTENHFEFKALRSTCSSTLSNWSHSVLSKWSNYSSHSNMAWCHSGALRQCM